MHLLVLMGGFFLKLIINNAHGDRLSSSKEAFKANLA